MIRSMTAKILHALSSPKIPLSVGVACIVFIIVFFVYVQTDANSDTHISEQNQNEYIVTITGGTRITYNHQMFMTSRVIHMYVVSGINMETGERMTFKCVDDENWLKWNSSDYFFELTNPDNRGIVYKVTTTGVREPWNDEYENIVRFEIVHGWLPFPPLSDDQRIERIINKFGEIRYQ